MKRMMMAGLLLPALALCACGYGGVESAGSASTPPAASLTTSASATGATSAHGGTSAVAKVADTVVLQGSRALLLAEDSYQTVVAITTPMVDAGLIKGSNATRLRALNATVTDALVKGYAVKGEVQKAAAAARALDAISAIHALIGK